MELTIFFPTQLVPARTRTQVVRLGAQCKPLDLTEQSRGIGVPIVQLTTHVKSSTLYGCTTKFFQLDGLLLFCIIMGLRSASSTIICLTISTVLHFRSFIPSISSLGDNISSSSCITTEASPLPILDTPTDQGYILHMGADRTLCAHYVKVLEYIDFRFKKNGNIYYNLKVVLQSFSLVKGKSNLILYLSKRKKRNLIHFELTRQLSS